jgi:hypothetical protein
MSAIDFSTTTAMGSRFRERGLHDLSVQMGVDSAYWVGVCRMRVFWFVTCFLLVLSFVALAQTERESAPLQLRAKTNSMENASIICGHAERAADSPLPQQRSFLKSL